MIDALVGANGDGRSPVIRGVCLCLAHVPDLVRHGSKPSRDLRVDEHLAGRLASHARPFEDALAYPPNQAFIGNLTPQQLWDVPEPWWQNGYAGAARLGPHGEIMPQEEFFCLMRGCDDFDIVALSDAFISESSPAFAANPIITSDDLAALGHGVPIAEIEAAIADDEAIPLYSGGVLVGAVKRGHPQDASLDAAVLLENLAAKASAVLALRHLLASAEAPDADAVEYVLGCGEEAVGDRYQRGGGNLAKAVAERAGCVSATGSDIKAFCCSPNHSIVMGSAMVRSELFDTVAVVGGGSLAKLGMKYEGHLKHDMPVLEDMLASIAVIVGADDGASPVIDLKCVGKHNIGAGSSQQAIAQATVLAPLESCGLRLTDIDRFATELHNPELTLPQGSGNVPRTNYRVLASLAARRGEIDASETEDFIRQRCMPGYSPTQGHIASAVPYLAHARAELMEGVIERAFFFAKGSLFLGRMTEMSDGFSFLIRRNPNSEGNDG